MRIFPIVIHDLFCNSLVNFESSSVCDSDLIDPKITKILHTFKIDLKYKSFYLTPEHFSIFQLNSVKII